MKKKRDIIMDKNRKNKKRRKKKMSFFTVFSLILLLYSLSVLNNQRVLKRNLNARKEEVLKEISILEDSISAYEEDLEGINSLEFIEKMARDKYNMVKPNEIMFKIEDGNKQ